MHAGSARSGRPTRFLYAHPGPCAERPAEKPCESWGFSAGEGVRGLWDRAEAGTACQNVWRAYSQESSAAASLAAQMPVTMASQLFHPPL